MSESLSGAYADVREQISSNYTIAEFGTLTNEQQDAFDSAMRLLLEPLYGSQDTALEKIHAAEDRRTEVVLNEYGQPVAPLVYKTNLVSELHWDMRYGDTVRTTDVLEVKTLALFQPDVDGGHGIGSMLVSRVDAVAERMGAKGVMLTVSDAAAAQDFFTRRGYTYGIYRAEPNKGSFEHVLYRPLQAGGIDKSGRWFS